MDNTKPVVKETEPVTEAPVSEDIKTQEPKVESPGDVQPKAQAGDKTDPNLLLKSLKEEREKVKKLEEELALKESPALTDEEVYSDEALILKNEISALNEKFASMEAGKNLQELQSKHPVLKEREAEFQTFRDDPENKGMSLNTAAKAYLVENELTEPTRKGLEKTTGGPRVPATSGKMTVDDVRTLRETNFKKYQDMLSKGLINISE